MSEWIPSEEFLKLTFPKWNGRKILAEIRKNIKSITNKTFDEGLDRVLAAAAREKDMAVLQEILPLSFNCHPLGINHLYNYRLQTERKHPELVHGIYAFYPYFSWMRYFKFLPGPREEPNFVPCVNLQGTLLHIAAHASSLKMVEFFHQQHGANLNATNCCGRTPLMVGVHNTEVALYFINNGCNVNHQDRWGHTVLMLIAWRAKTCKFLLKPLLAAGADPKMMDKYGKTFVHYACELSFNDGNCIPYVIENNIFDIDCRDNGNVSYAGRPIIFTHDFSSIHKAIRKMQSPPGTVFHAYLDLCELMSTCDENKFKKRLPSTFKSIKEKGSPYLCAPPNALYGNRKEVTSVEEFDALLHSSNDLRLEYLYQHLIIAERITGAYSLETISYLYEIIVHIHNAGNAIQTGKLLCLWMERASIYCETYLPSKLILKSLTFFEMPIIESSGLTSEENKALLSEFLTSYAKLTRKLAGADLHMHRYCHRPACDIAVVLYGLCYMELLNPKFCCKAAFIMSYYIYQSIKGEIPQLDGSLINNMIHSSEVHPFSPFIHSAQKTLVQPSTLLYAFLSWRSDITDDMILMKVYFKILEVCTVDLVNAFVPDRSTMLHFAVERDSPKLVELLLSHNAHPDAVDNQGNPPLAIASSPNPAILLKLSVPNRLECIASKRVIEAGIPYQNIDLPKKVVKIINFHDKNRFYELNHNLDVMV